MSTHETEKILKQQKYLTPGKMLPTLPNFIRASVRQLSKVLLLTSVGTVLTASPGWAVGIKPTAVNVTLPPTGTSNNPGTVNGNAPGTAANPYTDDILLSSITFGTGKSAVTFQSSNNSFFPVLQTWVISQPETINAEFGDNDNGSDNNHNPFVTAGVVPAGTDLTTDPNPTRESTDPKIQLPAIKAAFNSLSLSQGIDGENPATSGVASYTVQLVFQSGIKDNNSANSPTSNTPDITPELLFFERGVNSDFSVQAITGGTFNNPTLSNAVTVSRTDMFNSGKYINTIEIGESQELGVIGIDMNEFGITSTSAAIYGVRITSTSDGADLYGNFVSAATPGTQFVPVPSALVPEPLTILGSGIALGFGALMKIQYSRKAKKANVTD